ncbi:MAG: chromosomal replication initiator protein DnaA [Thermodesulfobacteriota bacterium]
MPSRANEIWDRAKKNLQQDMPANGYLMWIEPMRFVSGDAGKMTLECPNDFYRKWVMDNYLAQVKDAVSCEAGVSVALTICAAPPSGPAPEKKPEPASARREPASARPEPRQMPLYPEEAGRRPSRSFRSDFTFDRFVVGRSNEFAYTLALSVASRKTGSHSPLFLLSKTGLGKSHLSHAMGNHIRREQPEKRVVYVTAEEFTNEMVSAIQGNSISRFKDKYRKNCDVLLLEDVQFLSGKERTQMELACTLDCLMESRKKLVFTSTHLPQEIPKLHQSVYSRLAGGVISTIEAPDFAMRVRILKNKANGHRIPLEVLEFLASEIAGDVRTLESGIAGLLARSSLLSVPVDLGLAREVVKGLGACRKVITLSTIVELVSRYYKVSSEELMSKSRRQKVVIPRQVAMYLARRYTDQSLPAIGRFFNRYHATALHALSCVEKKLAERSRMGREVEFFCKKIEEGEI